MLPAAILVSSLLSWPDCPSHRPCTCLAEREPTTIAEARRAVERKRILFVARIDTTTFRRDSSRVVTADGDSTWFPLYLLVATVSVRRILKGAVPNTATVETPAFTDACGADLKTGLEFLVDADEFQGRFLTSKCSWTRVWSDDDPFVALLKATAGG